MTANIALPGRTLVCLPGARGVGVSRRITDETERERLRRIVEGFGPGAGWIARTAAGDGDVSGFLADKRYLEDLASRIRARREKASGPLLLHRELDLALRSRARPRDPGLRGDPGGRRPGRRADRGVPRTRPPRVSRLASSCTKAASLSSSGSASRARSRAPCRAGCSCSSGGSVVIHQTEALVAIDVNTGRFVGKRRARGNGLRREPGGRRRDRPPDPPARPRAAFSSWISSTWRTRSIAARSSKRFEKELAKDRARTRMLQISEFGLVELTRQRSRGNLERTLTRPCPCCGGSGRVEDGPDGRPRPAAAAPRGRRPLHPGGDSAPARAVLARQAPGGGGTRPPPRDRDPAAGQARPGRGRHPPPTEYEILLSRSPSVFRFSGMNS